MDNFTSLRRAVFLDRDGTVAEEVGYVNHVDRFQVFPYAAGAIRRLNQNGFAVIVVTNQSGVARGFFPESLVHEVHAKMRTVLSTSGARVDGIYFCPHVGADACTCRKPLPGMLERAAREHGLDLGRSFLVGDRYSDIEMGRAAGCRTVLVLTGYGLGEREWHRDQWAHPPDRVAANLAAAVDWILEVPA